MSVTFRPATPADAEAVALLHADSWRRFYRGAFADSYLDGDLETERRSVWAGRLGEPSGTVTVVAEDARGFAGFVHVMLDHDPVYGSLLDNLHVAHDRQRSGIGRALIVRAAEGVVARAARPTFYLWVLEQNTRAQAFYQAQGGQLAGREAVNSQPKDRLNGDPYGLRVVWPDARMAPPR
ncbi:GNAT family N-acetyltransferase [Tenggerimyces flavus]|uniref:GNAT family N-acetyltransferase n=1 Tax=Tenggerimyces flavus TaxID=1708749 RepID=A0ABV7YDN5_9ACTN|nr:N-acetyltransferase [Tenggerimyces flavus]MBM7788102.1 ribosomal protein S18 acetylase RimI-like enzyme [Tenggerimyces flavus]